MGYRREWLDPTQILSIERPDSRLLTYYVILCCLLPPFSFIALPLLFFRYHTMRYRFDAEGVSMRWGILFRREVNLTYARIQDIHLTSGVIQRWLGLADVHIQTASGTSTAEMKIEGILEFEALRDYLYTRMRGYRDRLAHPAPPIASAHPETPAAADPSHTTADAELVTVLRDIQAEMRQIREAVQAAGNAPGAQPPGDTQ
ncbi:MAG: PH domain-containing protein [Candidatus Sumerlaeaceae bacterium]|nr:PH domain-containing protein [Candidatus Sumerlaeaceae bacterium]